LILLAPPAIRFVYLRLRRSPGTASYGPLLPPPTVLHRIYSALLLLAAIQALHAAFLASPPNIFRDLQLDLDAPNFLLRNRVRDHIAQQLLKNLDYEHSPEAQRLMQLNEKLKSTHNRRLYSGYGESTFLTCANKTEPPCLEAIDYQLQLLPRVSLEYLTAAVLLGLATFSPYKARWRNFFPSVLVSVFTFEASLYIAHDLTIESGDFLGFGTVMMHDLLWMVRHCILAALYMLVYYVDRPVKPTVELIAQYVANQQRTVQERLATLRLMQSAVARDETLRHTAEAWFKDRELARSEILKDDAVVKARGAATKIMNLDALQVESEQHVDKLLYAALVGDGSNGGEGEEVRKDR